MEVSWFWITGTIVNYLIVLFIICYLIWDCFNEIKQYENITWNNVWGVLSKQFEEWGIIAVCVLMVIAFWSWWVWLFVAIIFMIMGICLFLSFVFKSIIWFVLKKKKCNVVPYWKFVKNKW